MNDLNLEGWKSVQIGRGSRETLELAVMVAIANDEKFAAQFWAQPRFSAFLEADQQLSFTFRVGAPENPCFFWPGGRALTLQFLLLEARLLQLGAGFELQIKPHSRLKKRGDFPHALIYLPESQPSAHQRLEMMMELKKRLEREFSSEEIAVTLELTAPQS